MRDYNTAVKYDQILERIFIEKGNNIRFDKTYFAKICGQCGLFEVDIIIAFNVMKQNGDLSIATLGNPTVETDWMRLNEKSSHFLYFEGGYKKRFEHLNLDLRNKKWTYYRHWTWLLFTVISVLLNLYSLIFDKSIRQEILALWQCIGG